MNHSAMLSFKPAPNALADRVILVTGAGQGLGRAIALAIARLGGTVVLHGRQTAKLERVYDEIAQAGGPDALIFPLDLAHAKEHDFEQMAGAIESQLGALAGVVHCAADLLPPAPIEQQRMTDWARTFQVNVAAPMALTRACARLLRAAPDASVLFTGETHGLHPAAYWGGFAAAKGALITLTKVLAHEWAHLAQLRVNLIVPGRIDSPQRSSTHPGENVSERRTMDFVVPAYLYLLCGESRGVTGEVFELQGDT